MDRPKKISDALRAAADWIEEHGHCVGAYGEDANGRRICPRKERIPKEDCGWLDKAVKADAYGALRIVLGGATQLYWDTVSWVFETMKMSLGYLNDMRWKTKDNAVAGLRAAADRAHGDNK